MRRAAFAKKENEAVNSEQYPVQALIENNVSFARNVSRKFFSQRSEMGIEFEEFYSAALLGLCDAAQRFDTSKGENFQTYSYLRIRGAMYDLIRRGGWVARGNIPWLQLENETVDADEDESEKPREQHVQQKRKSFVPSSVFELAGTLDIIDEINLKVWVEGDGDHAELSYSDQLDPESHTLQRNLAAFLCGMLVHLPEKERQIIELHYFEGWTFEEMRHHFAGVSRSWLSRLHSRAVKRLRAQIELARRNCDRRLRSAEYDAAVA